MSEKIKSMEECLKKAKTWSSRMDKLLKKKKKINPDYSEAEFCRKHDFDYGFFNRNKNLKVIPTKKTVDAIEKAFKKEKV